MNPNQPTTPPPTPATPDLTNSGPSVVTTNQPAPSPATPSSTPPPTPPQTEAKGSKLPVIILLTALGILVLAGGGYYLYARSTQSTADKNLDRTVTTPSPTPQPTPTIQQELNSVATDSAVDQQISTVDKDLPSL